MFEDNGGGDNGSRFSRFVFSLIFFFFLFSFGILLDVRLVSRLTLKLSVMYSYVCIFYCWTL